MCSASSLFLTIALFELPHSPHSYSTMVQIAFAFALIISLLGMISHCLGHDLMMGFHNDTDLINFGTNVVHRDDDPTYFLLYDDGRCAHEPYVIRHSEYQRRYKGGCFAFGSYEYYSVFTYRDDMKFFTGGTNDDGGCWRQLKPYKVNYCTWWGGGSVPLSGAIVPHGAD